MMYKNIDLKSLVAIATEASSAIMSIYNQTHSGLDVSFKSDNSPLTLADKEANTIITSRIRNLFPEIPLISEEENVEDFAIRKAWQSFWLIDPLDGTKEFIKHNGEFTVNIALIEQTYPAVGVICVPATNEIFFGAKGLGSFKMEGGLQKQIFARIPNKEMLALGSRSHASEAEASVLEKYEVTAVLAMGSSLKFCKMAEGKADLYYRENPTMEWDTAAGQAILECSGGGVFDSNLQRFSYNKPNLRNGSFLCLGNSKQL